MHPDSDGEATKMQPRLKTYCKTIKTHREHQQGSGKTFKK